MTGSGPTAWAQFDGWCATRGIDHYALDALALAQLIVTWSDQSRRPEGFR